MRTSAGNFTAADFTDASTGTSTTTHTITVATWTSGNRYLAFAIPTAETDLTTIRPTTAPESLNQIAAFPKASYTLTIAGTEYELWIYSDQAYQITSGTSWIIT